MDNTYSHSLNSAQVLVPVILSTDEFFNAVTEIAVSARGEARVATAKYNKNKSKIPGTKPSFAQQERLYRAQGLERLATDFEYLTATRLPHLPHNGFLELYVNQAAAKDFIKLTRDEDYSLDNLALARDWFENAARATQHFVSRQARIDKALELNKHLVKQLKSQICDEFKQAAALETMTRTPFGQHLLDTAEKHKYDIRFGDIRPYANIHHDLRRGSSLAVCFVANKDRFIFMDTFGTRNDIERTILAGHECGHVDQYNNHLGIGRYNVISEQGLLDNVDQYASTLEAHSIACEYVLGQQLMEAGVNRAEINNNLRRRYGIPVPVINTLMTNPASFIHTVSQSETVRRRWRLSPKEMRYSPGICHRLSQSIPLLRSPWMAQPQDVPSLDL